MARDLLLVLGMLMATALQLRPAGAKIGPGEACLLLWLLLVLAGEVRRLGPPLTPVLLRVVAFWIVFAFGMSLGTMTGYAMGDLHDPTWFLHDTMAYSFVAAISCLAVVEPGAAARLRRTAWLLAGCGTGWLLLQVAYGWRLINIGDVDPWYWDRLRGLCENPNQLALVSAIIGLVSLHLAESSRRPHEKVVAIIFIVAAVFVGRLTKSDSFLIVAIATASIFVMLKLRSWLLSSHGRPTLRSSAAWLVVFALPLMLVLAIPMSSAMVVEAEDIAKDMAKGKASDTEETARVRLHNWGAAIGRGIESGMLGLGPGPHLEIPPSILAGRNNATKKPRYMEHPQLTFPPNFEAHNTVLDLFTQGGLIVVVSFLWLMSSAFLMTVRAGLDALATLICGLAVFSTFHLIVRHPIVWFAIIFCMVAATEARAPSMLRFRS